MQARPFVVSFLGIAVLSDLAPKTNHMFHFTGKNQSTPNCPVQLVANFNPGTGSQSFRSSDKNCTEPAKYRLPFYLKDMGPRYNAISVAAHEARPGHHTQVRHVQQFKVTRPSFLGGVPSYFEALWYPHLYFYRKSNIEWITYRSIYNIT